jgi:alpha-L-fucosidase 2
MRTVASYLVLTGLLLGLEAAQSMAEVTFSGNAPPPADTLCLWYKTPAPLATPINYNSSSSGWISKALPLGNGRMGAMVFGGVQHEYIQFNEKSLWTGTATTGVGSGSNYQNFGYVQVDFPGFTAVTNYRRYLSLDSAIHKIEYTVGNVTYYREYFISYPENLMVMRFYSNAAGMITCTASIDNTRSTLETVSASGSTISLSGKLDIVTYEAQLNVLNQGGTQMLVNNQITVTGADTVTLFLCGSTDYSATATSYASGIGLTGVKAFNAARITASRAKSYAGMKAAHIADHQSLFNRLKVRLANNVPQQKPTDTMLINYAAASNPMMDILVLQMGRYFTIAGNRDNSPGIPTNLQGLWNDSNTPGWSSDFHTDINVEMNYFGAEAANLIECATPYTNWIFNQAVVHSNWKSYAGGKGWTVFTQNNIFGQANWGTNYYGLGAWLCLDLWKHFAFSMDTTFLRDTAYPVLKSQCAYQLSLLKTVNDTLMISGGDSPEQGITDNGTAFGQQLCWDVITNTISACTILNTDLSYRDSLKATLAKLDNGMRIGTWGQLKEWRTLDDYNPATGKGSGEPQHRHCSHMICLYPGTELQPLTMPALAQAIKTSLDARGTGGYGWSMAWRMALRARLFDGNTAYSLLGTLIKGGSFQSNLFDLYGGYIFQIDANYGAMAAGLEMLVQSNAGMIHLMPAVPDAWAAQGEVKGIRARGGFEVTDLAWGDGRHFISARVKSYSGDTCAVKINDSTRAFKVFNEADGSLAAFSKKADVITFPTIAGGSYLIAADAPISVRSNRNIAVCQAALSPVGGNRIALTVSHDGIYTVKTIGMNGRVISAQNITVTKGRSVVVLSALAARQAVVVSVSGNGIALTTKIAIQ